VHLLGNETSDFFLAIHDNFADRIGLRASGGSFKFLPYQLSMVV